MWDAKPVFSLGRKPKAPSGRELSRLAVTEGARGMWRFGRLRKSDLLFFGGGGWCGLGKWSITKARFFFVAKEKAHEKESREAHSGRCPGALPKGPFEEGGGFELRSNRADCSR